MTLKQTLRWMWLTMLPPRYRCPVCDRPTSWRTRRDGVTVYRCWRCCVKFSRSGERFMWRERK
jgi:hypothetical protein